jgi:hypothetical protein
MSNQSPFYQAPGHPSHNPGQSPLSQSNSTFRPYPPVRQESFTPHTPSNLSHASSPAAGPPYSMATPSSSANRAGPTDLAGPSRRTADRKHSIDTSQDEPSGKKKRVSLSCAQCEFHRSVPPSLRVFSLSPYCQSDKALMRIQAPSESKKCVPL